MKAQNWTYWLRMVHSLSNNDTFDVRDLTLKASYPVSASVKLTYSPIHDSKINQRRIKENYPSRGCYLPG